jgi:hypothetical protein
MSSEESDLAGTFILNGVTTNYLFQPGLTGSAGLDLVYTLPAFSTVGNPVLVTLTTPFTATAGISTGLNETFIMNGGGTATIDLSLVFPNFPDGSPALYRLQSAHYEFVLVPEPGTAALILIGLIGCSAIAFARRVKLSLPQAATQSINATAPAPLRATSRAQRARAQYPISGKNGIEWLPSEF